MFHRAYKQASISGVVIASACLLSGVSTQAAQYLIKPSVTARTAYDDNLLLNTDGSTIKTFSLRLAPKIQAQLSTGKWQADFDGSVTLVRMEDDGFNSDDQNVSLQLSHRSETSMFQLVALNKRESTLVTDLDELGELGFGVERRDRQYLRPSYTWTLNSTNRLAFGVSGENVHYGGLDFSDYDYYVADVSWTHQFDEKTAFDLTTFGSDYSSVPPTARIDSFFACVFGFDGLDGLDSETIGVQLGGSRQPTSRLRYRGSFGYRDVKTTTTRLCTEIDGSLREINSSDSSEGFVLDTGVTYQGEKYGVDVALSRSISPAGLGFLTERDEVKINVAYQYSEQISVALGVNGYSSESIDENFLFDRDGLQVTPQVNWRLTEKLNVSGGIRYRSAKSINTTDRREGITVFLGVNYRFKPTTFSR